MTGETPLNIVTTIAAPMTTVEPHSYVRGDKIVFTGTEVAAQVVAPPAISGQTTHIPVGGCLLALPMNPLMVPGMRIARTLSQYDQYHLVKLVYEYVPMCAATASGGLVGACVPNLSNNPCKVPGMWSIRQLMARGGSCAWNVYGRAQVHLNEQQQSWYYTTPSLDANLQSPGTFIIAAATEISNESYAEPFGLVMAHYEVAVRAPSIVGLPTANPVIDGVSLAVNEAHNSGGGTIVTIPELSTLWGERTVTSAIVAAVSDDSGSNLWRQVRDELTGVILTLDPGSLIYLVPRNSSANQWYIAANLNDALNTQVDSYVWAATVSAGTARGFKLWQCSPVPTAGRFTGSTLQPDDESGDNFVGPSRDAPGYSRRR